MKPILVRAALLLCCVGVLVQKPVSIYMVAGIMLAIIAASMGIYTTRQWVICGGLILLFGYSLFWPVAMFLYPVLIFELVSLYKNKKYQLFVIFFDVAMIMSCWQNFNGFTWPQRLQILFLMILAVVLNYICYHLVELEKKFVLAQDNSRELNRQLQLKNMYLMEKQDSDIYTATLQERNRIAREIHDNVGHMLSRSILLTGALQAINKQDNLKPGLEGLNTSLNEAMSNIRASVHDLHDESIDLEQAIREITKDLKEYDVQFDYDMSDKVPRNIKYALIAIVKEAVSNILKHSRADKITIMLMEHPALYRLAVVDNGVCEKMDMSQAGMGLQNITDRAQGLGGNVNIKAERSGFKVYVSIPKKKEEQNEFSNCR